MFIFRVYQATPIVRNYKTCTHFPSRLLFLEGQTLEMETGRLPKSL
jgi:hypothetical protein